MPKIFKDQDGKDFEVDEAEVVHLSSELFRPRGKKIKVVNEETGKLEDTGEIEVTREEWTTVITLDQGRSYKRTPRELGEVKRELGKGKI